MTEFLTQDEVAARDKAVADFASHLETCEKHKLSSMTIDIAAARLVLDEILRLHDVEEAYDDAMSAAEDHRGD